MAAGGPGPLYGARQRRPLSPDPADDDQLIELRVRVPVRLRAKARRASATVDMSVSGYVAQLIDRDEVDAAGRPLCVGEVPRRPDEMQRLYMPA